MQFETPPKCCLLSLHLSPESNLYHSMKVLTGYTCSYLFGLYAGLCLVTQSCPTLCDPMDCHLPGSSVCGILQAKILEWVPCPSPGDFPHPVIKPRSPTLQADSLPSELPGKLLVFIGTSYTISFHLDVCFLEDSNEWKCILTA